MSRIDMNMPSNIARKAMSFLGSIWSTAGGAAGLAARGGDPAVVLADDMARLSRADRLLIRCRAGVDVDDDTQARAQTTGIERILRQCDANRHALDDLGEITSRIFRRQEREDRAGSRRD